MPRKKVLYVVHKSLTEPIPRLHGLAQARVLSARRPFAVLSYEPRNADRRPGELDLYDETREWLTSAGVAHLPLPFLRSRWLDIPLGAAAIVLSAIFQRVRIVHCRSYIPGLMGLLARRITPTRFLFDMRGLFVDEYLFVGGFRPGTARLAFARWLERRLLFRADAVVVVSEKFREHLLTRPDLAGRLDPGKVYLIPNRVDLSRFRCTEEDRERLRREHGWQGSIVAACVASSSSWHRLDRTLEVASRAMASVPGLRLVVATYPSTTEAERLADRAGLPADRVDFVTVGVSEIPGLLAAADVSLMLEARHLVRNVCAPIKFSEYAAAGLPVIANEGIGDVSRWIEERGLGLIIDPDRVDDAAARVAAFLKSEDFRGGAARGRCLDFATRTLDMASTLDEYESIYRDLDAR